MNCCTGCIHRASLQCTVEQLPVKQETGFQNNNSPHQLLAPKQTTVEQTAVKQTSLEHTAVEETSVKLKTLLSCLRSNAGDPMSTSAKS